FIHIIRDPRDVALSSHRAWGSSITRSILNWERHIEHALEFTSMHSERIHHLRYEDLTSTPEDAMLRISKFLRVEYEAATSRLITFREKLGDAAGRCYVMNNNSQKYLSHMTPSDIAKVDGHLEPLLVRF